MFCVVLSLACPHPRAIKPMALITYHSIQRAGKAIISGVESKVHGMDSHIQPVVQRYHLTPKFECGHRTAVLLNIKANHSNPSSPVKKDAS